MEPLPNMDILGEITRTIANITQKIGRSILLTLLLNNNYLEAGKNVGIKYYIELVN